MPRKIRPIRVEGNIAYVTLTRGHTAVIDAADVHLVCGRNWFSSIRLRADKTVRTVYAMGNTPRREGGPMRLMLHRVIAGTPDGVEVDHRDGDGLNNRRENLRMATRAQNTRNRSLQSNNTSGVKGVRFDATRNKWRAYIRVCGVLKYIGSYEALDEASEAYAEASARLHGEFGRLR
mgnify:FL=1